MQKIIITSILLFLGVLSGFGQSKKNDLKLTVSGLPLFGSSEGFESGVNGLVIKTTFGYFITDKTSIDLNFSYATLNALEIGGVDSFYNSYAIVPTLRNNFINKQKIRVFGEIGFGFGTIKYDADDNSFRNLAHENRSGGISVLNIGIGGNYYFNDKFGLEIIIPYISTKNITSNRINNLYSGVGPTIGFTYKLN